MAAAAAARRIEISEEVKRGIKRKVESRRHQRPRTNRLPQRRRTSTPRRRGPHHRHRLRARPDRPVDVRDLRHRPLQLFRHRGSA